MPLGVNTCTWRLITRCKKQSGRSWQNQGLCLGLYKNRLPQHCVFIRCMDGTWWDMLGWTCLAQVWPSYLWGHDNVASWSSTMMTVVSPTEERLVNHGHLVPLSQTTLNHVVLPYQYLKEAIWSQPKVWIACHKIQVFDRTLFASKESCYILR